MTSKMHIKVAVDLYFLSGPSSETQAQPQLRLNKIRLRKPTKFCEVLLK